MRELSLFSGAGGGLLATVHLLGWEPIGYVEIDEYCQRVLRARIDDGLLPDAPIFTDVRKFLESGAAAEYRGFADVVTGGFPCQAYSAAARGRQRADRDLWPETAEVVRAVRPSWVFLENVLGAFPDEDATCLSASNLGAPHRRPRGWLVAHSDSESQSRRPIDEEMAWLRGLSEGAWWAPDMARTVGVDDVVAYRMDRLRALGNGQVSAVAAAAWRLLSQ